MNVFSESNKTDSGIAYYSQGESNDVVLLVHGSFGTAMMWALYVPFLVEAGYRVIALDLAGHGASDGDLLEIDMDSYVDNVRDVIAAENIDPVLVGHSMSGLTVLMCAVAGMASTIIAIDPSPSLEVQGGKSTDGIPDVYDAVEAGMPTEPAAAMKALPDIAPEMLAKLGEMLGDDSGSARRQRKAGISIPKDVLDELDVLFFGAKLGKSIPFGISPESTEAMADYYEKQVYTITGATHPGILMGSQVGAVVEKILEFLKP